MENNVVFISTCRLSSVTCEENLLENVTVPFVNFSFLMKSGFHCHFFSQQHVTLSEMTSPKIKSNSEFLFLYMCFIQYENSKRTNFGHSKTFQLPNELHHSLRPLLTCQGILFRASDRSFKALKILPYGTAQDKAIRSLANVSQEHLPHIRM